jgi:hypothetical protein
MVGVVAHPATTPGNVWGGGSKATPGPGDGHAPPPATGVGRASPPTAYKVVHGTPSFFFLIFFFIIFIKKIFQKILRSHKSNTKFNTSHAYVNNLIKIKNKKKMPD